VETSYRYKPVLFFGMTYMLSWVPWLIAAHFSFLRGQELHYTSWIYLGLLGPFLSALILTFTSKNDALKRDLKDRLINLRRFSLFYLPVTLLLMPCATFFAIWVSVTFLGRSPSQLALVPNVVSWIPLMFLAPTIEELGWRGYGMDALRSKTGALTSSLLFGVLWSIWHGPLVLINHTYQHEVWMAGPIYVVNFFAGNVPLRWWPTGYTTRTTGSSWQ